MRDLELASTNDLITELQAREGLVSIVAVCDLKECGPEPVWRIGSNGSIPVRFTLGEMITEHMDYLKKEIFSPQGNEDDQCQS